MPPQLSPSLRKAAILIASLDRHTADALLEQFGPREAELLRRAIVELDDFAPVEQQQVIDEFFRIAPQATKTPSAASARGDEGVELDAALAQRLHLPSLENAAPPSGSRPSQHAPFRFLEEADAAEIADVLGREHPQTAVVVLAHLPPERAAGVLAHFPATLQSELLGRLADLDQTDPEVLAEIERVLQAWFSQTSSQRRRRAAGAAAVNQILSASDPQSRRRILSNVAGVDPLLAARLGHREAASSNAPTYRPPSPRAVPVPPSARKVDSSWGQRPTNEAGDLAAKVAQQQEAPLPRQSKEPAEAAASLTFDDLASLDEVLLAAVLQTADPQVVQLALAGADRQLIDRIVRNLPARHARQLERSLYQLGPTRLSEVEAARDELAALARGIVAAALGKNSRRISVAA